MLASCMAHVIETFNDRTAGPNMLPSFCAVDGTLIRILKDLQGDIPQPGVANLIRKSLFAAGKQLAKSPGDSASAMEKVRPVLLGGIMALAVAPPQVSLAPAGASPNPGDHLLLGCLLPPLFV